jgi:hypothetical protein
MRCPQIGRLTGIEPLEDRASRHDYVVIGNEQRPGPAVAMVASSKGH